MPIETAARDVQSGSQRADLQSVRPLSRQDPQAVVEPVRAGQAVLGRLRIHGPTIHKCIDEIHAPALVSMHKCMETRRPRMGMAGLDGWYSYMASHDRAALWELLHPDAVFESPVVH